MSLLEPKTIPMFYFSGEKATTPTCPVDMRPNLNPSSGAQSYRRSNADCTQSAKYNIPFFLENLGPRFSEWSVNAHEARPGHHTQVKELAVLFKRSLFSGVVFNVAHCDKVAAIFLVCNSDRILERALRPPRVFLEIEVVQYFPAVYSPNL